MVIRRIFLPINNGGLGLNRHYGITTEKDILITELRFLDWLQTFSPDEFMHINNLLNAPETIPGKAENAILDTELTIDH
jgi:hypothetical protein